MCMKMSDVRLSNASPTLERVDTRQPDSVRPSVRRCLFGSPNPNEVRRELQTFIQEDVQRFRDTYNFDPVNDNPLPPGRYVWEVDNDAPEFYRRPPHERRIDVSSQRDRAEAEGQTTATQQRSRKRPSGSAGSCCSEPRSKSPRTNGEDDDEKPDDETCQAVQVSEEVPSSPEDQ